MSERKHPASVDTRRVSAKDVLSASRIRCCERSHLPHCRVGYGSGRASCVTRTGQSDLAKTACVVDVHWRGGPITRTSTSDVSAALTISVAGTPCLTTTSMSHHALASGGSPPITGSESPTKTDWFGHHAHAQDVSMCLPCERERLPDDADGRWRQINRTQNLFEHAGSRPIDSPSSGHDQDWTVGTRDDCRSHGTHRTRRPFGAGSPHDNHIGTASISRIAESGCQGPLA